MWKKRLAVGLMALLLGQALFATPGFALEAKSPLIKGKGSASKEKAKVSIPEEYVPVLSTYYDVLYAGSGEDLTWENLQDMGLCPLLSDLPAGEEDHFGYYLRDINQDGVMELFLGYQNSAYVETVYQMFTVTDGELSLVFTADETDSLYLLSNNTLLLKGYVEGEEVYDYIYVLEEDGNVYMAGGVFFDLVDYCYYALMEDMDPEDGILITEEAYNAQLEDYELKREYLTYTSLAGKAWEGAASAEKEDSKETGKTGKKKDAKAKKAESEAEETVQEVEAEEEAPKAETEETASKETKKKNKKTEKKTKGKTKKTEEAQENTQEAKPQDGEETGEEKKEEVAYADMANSLFYSHEVIYDQQTGIPVANILLPKGWRASLSMDWSFMSTDSPGVATLTLDSPDSLARITLVSNRAFCDMSTGGMRYQEGYLSEIYNTNLYYRNAEDMCAYFTGGEQPSRSLSVSPAMVDLVEEAARVKLGRLENEGIYGLGSEGTVARNLYESEYGVTDLCVFVVAAEVSTGQSIDTIFWNVPITFRLDTASWEAYEMYAPVFEAVAANSDFTGDFLFVNVSYGASIAQVISQGLTDQTMESLLSNSDSWLDTYQSSPEYDSDTWAKEWSDVIYERNEYETLDGGTIKVDTAYDSVYQDGDSIYMGPDGLAPDGWTKLEETY